MDRRAIFFACAALVCGLLIPFIPHEEGKPDISWVGWWLVIGYSILAVLSALDAWSRSRKS